MANQKPTIGRTVIFTAPEGIYQNGASEFVAVIGQVFDSQAPCCNLFVMPPFAAPYWEGSVQEGEGPRTWRWPTRV